jgi:hypothetical protein
MSLRLGFQTFVKLLHDILAHLVDFPLELLLQIHHCYGNLLDAALEYFHGVPYCVLPSL